VSIDVICVVDFVESERMLRPPPPFFWWPKQKEFGGGGTFSHFPQNLQHK